MIVPLSLPGIARTLRVQVYRGSVLAPGPGHSERDRSLSVRLASKCPGGFWVHSFSGDDYRVCHKYVWDLLGMSSSTLWEQSIPIPRNRIIVSYTLEGFGGEWSKADDRTPDAPVLSPVYNVIANPEFKFNKPRQSITRELREGVAGLIRIVISIELPSEEENALDAFADEKGKSFH